ncbi:MAG: xanthine dehydrogenase family protein subunit M [Actinomycetia bacterium]|nr:xanthine dehydrogenase family protein subunit M [Actinomycetes bacterium]MCH9706810.1 xanthine dehydrogenase family protein subunit M [Actinomycetes bacterium]MCH9788642.1 xanthine dehydrogenase family protein subunit M [Actinomycetes bacterium]MCH9796955.1 xanthine dehydrogenase family protein subunit M [Actinomycetes bacterium]MCH9850024.1 xanthine dehydrogenase family protein subunit M [Actinomycetes bacterium]
MIPATFGYTRASTIDDAVAALASSDDAKVLGGGQSLLPVLRLRLNAPELVVDCSGIDEIKSIDGSGDRVVIGSGATHHAVMNDPAVISSVPLLAQATATVADPQIRHRGTVGGALAHADPRADQPPVALALDAEFTIAGPGGRRTVPAAEFFVGPFETAVGEDELLVSASFPKYDGWGSHYEKFNRTAQAWSIVGVGAAVRMDSGSIAEARIGLANVGGTPMRASATEQALVGASSMAEIEAACAQAADGLEPFADEDADVEFRKHLVTVLTKRAVATAAGISS